MRPPRLLDDVKDNRGKEVLVGDDFSKKVQRRLNMGWWA